MGYWRSSWVSIDAAVARRAACVSWTAAMDPFDVARLERHRSRGLVVAESTYGFSAARENLSPRPPLGEHLEGADWGAAPAPIA